MCWLPFWVICGQILQVGMRCWNSLAKNRHWYRSWDLKRYSYWRREEILIYYIVCKESWKPSPLVAQTHYPSTREAETGGLWVWDYPGIGYIFCSMLRPCLKNKKTRTPQPSHPQQTCTFSQTHIQSMKLLWKSLFCQTYIIFPDRFFIWCLQIARERDLIK